MLIGINIARVARLIRCRARHRKRGFAQRGAGECQDTSGAGRDSGTLRLRQRLSFLSAKLGPPRASPRVVGLGRRLVCILHRAGRVRQALRIARAPELNVVPAPLGCVAMLPARGAGGLRVPCPRYRSARCSQGCSTCWMPTSASSMAEHPECPVRPGGLFLSHELDVDPLRLLLSDPARPCRRSCASQIPCRLESLTAGLGARSDELPAGNFFVQLGAVQWARCERLRAGS